MGSNRIVRLAGALAMAVVLLGPQTLAAQGIGAITGRVIDKSDQKPLSGAQVVVVNTQSGALTDESGRFRLTGVHAGPATVRVVMLGYETVSKPVTVKAGGVVSVDFELSISAVSLNEVVVTATGEQQKRALANSVSHVDAQQVVQTAPITTFSDLLNARASGVDVLQSSGTVGGGTRIRIRGANSVSLSNEPIIYVDGARIDSNPSSLSVGTGGQSASRINDLDPEDIASIEVIKGPSAATLYGTDAANGVILITTRRGQSGKPRWSAYVEGGATADPHKGSYPLNYRGKAGAGTSAANCYAFQVGSGSCQQQSLLSYQPLNDPAVSPISGGNHQQYGMRVSGGSDNVNYYVSGDWLNEVGTLALPDSIHQALDKTGQVYPWQVHPNTRRQVSVRANLGAQLGPAANLTVSTGYVTSRTHFPQNDNNALGIVPSGMLGSYSPLLGQHGYGFLAPQEVFAIETLQEINRFTGSIQAKLQPPALKWLSGRADIGLDLTDRHDSNFSPVGAIVEFGPVRASGLRTSNRFLVQSWTGDATATANFTILPRITSRTTVGGQYFHRLLRGTLANGQGLTPGTKSLAASSQQFASEQTVESVTLGAFVEQQFGWHDRLFITGGLRGDDNSAFGQNFRFTTYPKLGVSYVAVDNGDSPLLGVLSSLRLRAAYGTSGRAPGPTDALRYYSASVTSIAGTDEPGVTFGAVGNTSLKPERSVELEAGFDAGLLNNRVGLEFTYYHKRTEDALIQRTLPPSLGVSQSRFENIGSVLNSGVEIGLNATVLDISNVRWDINANGSHNHNELLALGKGIEPIIFGVQEHKVGYPLGGYWDHVITYKDANGDGIISADEIQRADSATYLGSPFPVNALSLTNSFTLFNRFRVSALLDYRGDWVNYNLTEEFRCRFAICRGLNDPTAPLWEQARAVNTVTLGGNRSAAPYIENATFWKLREVSFAVFAPDSWARRVGARNLELVVTGRNLATWTNYTGLDPELNQIGQSNFSQRDFLTEPPVRSWYIRVNLGF